jgi:type VII secretion protein EccB
MARLATALVGGSPDNGENPTRLASLGTSFGVVAVVLLCIGFAVFGLVSPVATTSWKKAGTVVVENGSGNRFLYDGKALRPLRNIASALLISPKGAAAPAFVSAKSLAGVPIGAPVGIEDAPDVVPGPSALLSHAWTRCLRPGTSAGQVVDFGPSGRTSPFTAGHQALLAGPDGKRYLLADGTKHRVPGTDTLIVLGLENRQPVSAPSNWLAAVPSGADLVAPPIAGAGTAAGTVAGAAAHVGELFRTSVEGSDHFFVMLSDGIAPISATEAALMSARPGAAQPRHVQAADLASATVSKNRALAKALPDVLGMPPVGTTDAALCVEQQPQGTGIRTTLLLEHGPVVTGTRPVLMPAGHAVIAVDQDQAVAKANHPDLYFIGEDGRSFLLADGLEDAQDFGYGNAPLLAVPESVLALLPTGPRLGKAAATATVRQGA